ncbi:internal scaffolding protein [Sigmofec virus UA08Rod_6120]|uniref:Internal scaffolding protein n=1 Tax=Sigmofec virus UA08Rod_6120 TaxID=2929453 RepID=A0A976R6U7_9VIRU|nr:internal scaffolding protein [Sigmofec virus UA08Rod_6120]
MEVSVYDSSKSKVPFSGLRPSGERFFSPSGEQFEDEYGYVVSDEGMKVLEVVGKKDVYTLKQESLSSTYLRDVVSRYDRGLLTQQEFEELVQPDPAVVFDSTKGPQTLVELLQAQIEAENMFYSMPPDMRERWHQSKEKFYNSIMDGSAQGIFNEIYQQYYGRSSGSAGTSFEKEVKKDGTSES